MDEQNAVETLLADETSQTYLGRWNRLVSTTNWEKGRIIHEWRTALVDSGAPAQQYSDEAWSRLVGNVSSQHVGRLRRVHQQFAEVRDTYPGLYWSHFQAALDWDDAEMWLEGAVQNGWSVADMRRKRWQVGGAVADLEPRDGEIVSAELDEDYTPPPAGELHRVRDVGQSQADAQRSADDVAVSDEPAASAQGVPFDPDAFDLPAAAPQVRPFAEMPVLPDDLAEALEGFKLAILRHKMAGWHDVSCDDVLACLDALRQLALAPSDAE